MRQLLLIIGITILVLIGGFYSLNSFIYNQKQQPTETIKPYRGTLTGEYVCLEPRDTSSPQITECVFGIKTDVQEYYAVDFALLSQGKPDLQIGDRFTASGTITPIEMLSTDHWRKYKVNGIFSVTDSIKK